MQRDTDGGSSSGWEWTRLRIAVIGGGIAGMGAAWLLGKSHDVTLFERNGYVGGHSNTVDVRASEGPLSVDTGFIVYNTASYPNLIALFEHLKVPTVPTEMSFSVSLDGGAFEYSGNGLGGLFGQPSSLLSPRHWRMTWDILRFFREAASIDPARHDLSETLGAWLERRGYGRTFIERHILPMGAAIWSTPANEMLAFPLTAFVRFFENHGLLKVSNRPEWRTVVGGSRQYVNRLLADFPGRIVCGDAVISLARDATGVEVRLANGGRHRFDQCVIATHADEARSLIADADRLEREVLAPFRYEANEAVLHRDRALMPKRRRLWTSWNYLGSTQPGDRPAGPCITYWMNKLQPLSTRTDYFVTLNPSQPIAEDRIERRIAYNHPVFDRDAMTAQRRLWSLQGRNRLWFAGSYFGYGFHEDALQAGLAVAEDLGGVPRPWTVPDPRGRILADGCAQCSERQRLEAAE